MLVIPRHRSHNVRLLRQPLSPFPVRQSKSVDVLTQPRGDMEYKFHDESVQKEKKSKIDVDSQKKTEEFLLEKRMEESLESLRQLEKILRDEEMYIANELRQMCDSRGKEIDVKKSGKILHELGLLYQQRRSDKVSLIQCATLLNAAITRKPDNILEIENDLQNLCREILLRAGAERKDADLLHKAKGIMGHLIAMRNSVEAALNKVQTIPSKLKKGLLKKAEKEKVIAIKDIQDMICNDYTSIMTDIGSYCEHVMGKPPCQYAHVGMGSLARKEITSYSDFESIIVLEEGCQTMENYKTILNYFRWFSVIFQIIVTNLQETIIPSVNIASLSDISGNWFFDKFTTRGVSIDSMMLHGYKFPLGLQQKIRNNLWTTELIKPVSEMLYYLNTEELLKNGYHLKDILTKIMFVSGEKEIYNEFSKGIKTAINSSPEDTLKDEITTQIEIESSNFGVNSDRSTTTNKSDFDHKRIVYRSITLFISALGRLHKISANSCFDIIDELHRQHIISKYARGKLSVSVAVAYEIRLKLSIANKGHVDWVNNLKSIKHESIETANLIDAVGEHSSIGLFQVVYSLQCDICKQIETTKPPLYQNLTLLNLFICNILKLESTKDRLMNNLIRNQITSARFNGFDVEVQNLEKDLKAWTKIDSKMSENESTIQPNSDEFVRVSEMLFDMNAYNEALEFALKYLQSETSTMPENRKVESEKVSKTNAVTCFCGLRRGKTSPEENFVEPADGTHDRKVRAVGIVACCYFKLTRFDDALDNFKSLLEIGTTEGRNAADTLHWIGLCFAQRKDYQEAMSYFQTSLEEKKQRSKDEHTEKGIADTLYWIGHCLVETKNHQKALSYLQKSVEIKQQVTRDEDFDNDVAKSHFLIGLCLLKSKSYQEAQAHFQTSLKIKHRISLDEGADKQLADTNHLIGCCLLKVNECNEAMSYLKKSLKIYQRISQDQSTDEDVAINCHRIGRCLLKTGEYKDAIFYFQKSLKIQQVSSMEDDNKDMSDNFCFLGHCFMEMNEYQEALKYLRKSMVYHEEAPLNEDVANSLYFVVHCAVKIYKHRAAEGAFPKSLQIKQQGSLLHYSEKIMADTLHDLGFSLMRDNQYQEAANYLKKSLKIKQQLCFDVDVDPDLSRTQYWIGQCLMEAKEHHEALRYFRGSLKIKQQNSLFEDLQNDISHILFWIAHCLSEIKDYQEALNCLKESLTIRQRMSSDEDSDVDVGATLHEIGRCYMKTGEHQEGMSFILKALKIKQQASSNEDIDEYVADAAEDISCCLIKSGKHQEAISYLQISLKIKQRVSLYPVADEGLAITLQNLGCCLLETKDYQEAMKYLERSLKIHQRVSMDKKADESLVTAQRNVDICSLKMSEQEKDNKQIY